MGELEHLLMDERQVELKRLYIVNDQMHHYIARGTSHPAMTGSFVIHTIV